MVEIRPIWVSGQASDCEVNVELRRPGTRNRCTEPESEPFSSADPDILLSALAHPFATAGGIEVYPNVPAKAAALFRGIVKGHALPDGNKRLGVTTMSVFLDINGWTPRYTNGQLYKYALRVAAHRGAYPVRWIEGWIRRHCGPSPDSERAQIRLQNQAWLEAGLMDIAFDPDE